MIDTSLLIQDIQHTVLRMVLWTMLSWTGSILIAMILYRLHFIRPFTMTLINFLKQISPFAWLPFAIIIFGIGEPAVGSVMVMAMLLPGIFISLGILRDISKTWLEEARLCGASENQILLYLSLPVSMSHLINLLRQLWSIGWHTIIAAEMLGISSGLGYRLLDYRYLTAYNEMFIYLFIIAFIGFSVDYILQRTTLQMTD
jgi:NitT/TauT family transport system permease protein